MKLLALLLVSTLPSCELSRALLPQYATYGYVGKVRTGPPLKVDSNDYEVTMSFSGGEWGRNSGICFHHATAKIVDGEVRLKVFTGLCSKRSPRIYSFRLKEFSRSEYDLVYADPDGTIHPIGKLLR
jgi:hypothetical protein